MNYQYQLAIAAIFRDEARFLKEWIEFHREVGFEHFYLFDNLSTDSYQEILQPYIESGIVELFSWPIEHSNESDWDYLQRLAYERAIYFAKGKVKWLAFIDIDEFLFPAKEIALKDLLSQYEGFGGIGINWQVFGTSGVERIPDGRLLIETLYRKLPFADAVNHTIKTLAQPDRIRGCLSSHLMSYKEGFFQANTDGIRFEGKKSPYVQIDTLRINHYRCRDEHFLHTQKIPRIRKWWNTQSPEAWASYFESFNAISDVSIHRYIPKLKFRM